MKSPYLYLEGTGVKPLKDEMKITHYGRSIAVKRALTDFGIEESFGQAAKRFKEHYHFDICPSTVDRTVKESAKLAEIYMNKKLSESTLGQDERNAQPAEKMLVEMDGCEIRVAVWQKDEAAKEKTPVYGNPKKKKIVNWRDVRIGFARPLESDVKTYVGRMDTYPAVFEQLRGAAELRGLTPETQVVGVADGGIGLFEEMRRWFPGMCFILDKTHLKDHLYDTAESLGIEPRDRPAWVEPRLRKISNGDVECVLKELADLYRDNKVDRLRRLIGYLERFKECLNYDSFKEKGYPIGSGEIESAHKYVPQKRLKLPGASWHPDSINPMLALRILRADDYWDDYWKIRDELLLAA